MGYVSKVKVGSVTHPVASALYGTCTTAAGTAEKAVTCADFDQLIEGVTIHVKFTYSNTNSNPTLKVNNTGPKQIYRYGSTKPGTTAKTSWIEGAVVSFTYDGNNWMMNDWLNDDTVLSLGTSSTQAYRGDYGNTAYSHATDASRLTTATSSGLYKVASTAQGHIASLTAVAKSDITALGIPAQDTTYTSKSASSGGTDVSLVTTGEKYTWNNKSNLAIGTSATTAAAGNHTHTTSLAGDTGTSTVTLAANSKYKLTAGGTSVVFTTPPDNNTDTKVTSVGNHYAPATDTDAALSASASGASAAWGIDVVKGVTLSRDAKGHVTGVSVTSGKIPNNPNTDTKVTSSANHYTPATASGSDVSASASGATAAWSIDVVKGVTLNTDGKGHVTGMSVTSGKIPANPNTDTHRPIQVNGTQALGNNTTALNLQAGSNVTITDGGSGAVTIAATDTTYESKTAASGGTAVSLVTTGEKYTWNNKSNLALGTTSSTAYRGDYGNTAYTHATDSSRLTSAKSSGFYKIATTAQGHVASVTAVTKADITGLGIPGSDTDTHRVVKVNGTQALASNTTALNLIPGSNVSITDGGSGAITIAATDTKYNAATTSAAGLMSAADKAKLDSIGGINTYYIEGPSTDAAGVWTGTLSDITAYFDGLNIIYVPAVAGKSGSVTLNLNNLGAIQCYITDKGVISALTTHYPAGTPIRFTYVDGKFIAADYSRANDNTTNISTLVPGNGYFVANSAIYRYQMLVHVDDDKLSPFNNVNNSTGTGKTILTSIEFDPFKRIYYYYSTSNVSANGSIGVSWLCYSSLMDLRYSFNISASVNALIAHKDVYMKVIPQGNGKVKLASAFPLVQSLPNSDDGYWYIYLGRTYSYYQMSLYPHHPVYYHDGTAVRELVKGADIRYTEDSTPPSNPMDGTIWLQKKDSTSISGTNLPNAMFQTVSITIPHNTTSYTYTNSWITNETAIIQTDLAANGMRDTCITWNISTGQIVFTLGAALSRNITFQAAMIK